MKRTIVRLALVAASALALAACQTNPAKPEPAPAPAVVKKSLVEMEYELRKLEIEGQNAREERSQKALIKFGAESESEFARGVVAGLLGAGQKQAAAPEPSRRNSLLDSVAQADAIELRKLELQDKNSWWNRSLQLYDRVENLVMFNQGLKFKRFEIGASNGQQRYLFDTLRGTQQDGYGFSSGAYTQGSAATLQGVAAGRTPAPAATETATPAAE